jgi:hypothetical protein
MPIIQTPILSYNIILRFIIRLLYTEFVRNSNTIVINYYVKLSIINIFLRFIYS